MKLAFWVAIVPALLGTTAVVAQDGFFAAGLSIGGGAIKLPSGQNGVLTLGDVTVTGNPDPLLPAGTLGFNAAAGLGKWGEYDAYAGLNLFATYGTASWSGTQNFSGIGTVYIPGISLPDNGSIELHTTRGDEVGIATSNVIATSPQGSNYNIDASASTVGGVGAQSDAAVSGNADPAPNSFVVAGTNTEVSAPNTNGTALAYGGIADTSGSLLIITGDLAGLSISTQTSTQVLYAGGDLTVGVSKVQDETTALQAYAGPSYRFLGQWSNTTIGATQLSVDIPEEASPTVHPLWDQTTTFNTALNSHYFGGVLGAGVSKQVSDKVSVSAGAELSGYYTLASLNGRGSVRTHDGVSPSNVDSPDITVVQDPVNVLTHTLAFAARAQASATYALADNTGLTVAGSVDYLSAVARPYGGAAVTGSGGNASWSSGSGDNSAVSFGDMFVFTGTVTLSGQF